MKEVLDAITGALPPARPAFIGVGGAVAVGKTTVARAIGHELEAPVVSTDSFLFANAVLAERDLVLRKGFPESYDFDLAERALSALRRGEPADMPVYSHDTYDVLPDAVHHLDPTPVVVVEGVVALQQPIRRHLDIAVYVDAPEDVVRRWFTERFLRSVDAAKTEPVSFYHSMAALDDDAVRSIAEMTWDGINAVNLAEHIAPSREDADILVVKRPDHAVASVQRR